MQEFPEYFFFPTDFHHSVSYNALSGIHKCGLALFIVVQKVAAGIKPLNLSPPLNLSVPVLSHVTHSVILVSRPPWDLLSACIIFLVLAVSWLLFSSKAVVISFVFTPLTFSSFKWIFSVKVFTSAAVLIEFSINVCKAALQTSWGSPLIQYLDRNEE